MLVTIEVSRPQHHPSLPPPPPAHKHDMPLAAPPAPADGYIGSLRNTISPSGTHPGLPTLSGSAHHAGEQRQWSTSVLKFVVRVSGSERRQGRVRRDACAPQNPAPPSHLREFHQFQNRRASGTQAPHDRGCGQTRVNPLLGQAITTTSRWYWLHPRSRTTRSLLDPAYLRVSWDLDCVAESLPTGVRLKAQPSSVLRCAQTLCPDRRQPDRRYNLFIALCPGLLLLVDWT